MSTIPAAIDSMRSDAVKVVERLYSPLVEQLDTTAEQSAKFYQILVEHRMSGVAQRIELLSHGDASRLAKSATESQKETEARLLGLLGEVRFSQYQTYQAGIGDRGTLELLQSDFAEQPLTKEQQFALLRAMASARKAGEGDPDATAGFSIADPGDVMHQKLKQQETLDQQILRQASAFLSPAQLQILHAAQVRLLAWRKNGHAKAQEMFGDRATRNQSPPKPSSTEP